MATHPPGLVTGGTVGLLECWKLGYSALKAGAWSCCDAMLSLLQVALPAGRQPQDAQCPVKWQSLLAPVLWPALGAAGGISNAPT